MSKTTGNEHGIYASQIADQLTNMAAALTSERDHQEILDQIIIGCMEMTNADGGTLYTIDDTGNELNFTVIHNRSLGIHRKPNDLPPIRLCNEKGQRDNLVVVQTFLDGITINIADVYHCTDYDFSGTRRFDKQLSYRSQSFLSVPLIDHEREVIGVLQLINAEDNEGNRQPFDDGQQALIESVASLAATVLTKRKLIDAQRTLFESFIKLIGRAIDHKSPVTGKHCEQVPEVAMMLADAVCRTEQGPLAELQFTEQELYELKVAAWLHDCGKITSPEYIIDKATKLHTMYDRIDLVETRMREYQQYLYIQMLERLPAQEVTEQEAARAFYHQRCEQLDDDLEFLKKANTGGEFMAQALIDRVHSLSDIHWTDIKGKPQQLLTKDEVDNLCISRGTLTDSERQVMRDHIKVSIDMLESLSYPKNLSQVPEIACNHHEHMNGSGYPRGLTGGQMSLRARIMCIADIFEALTAADRPYKKGMLLSKAMDIVGRAVEEGQLDPTLFEVFVREGVYLDYARDHMSKRQQDSVDLSNLPGYKPCEEL